MLLASELSLEPQNNCFVLFFFFFFTFTVILSGGIQPIRTHGMHLGRATALQPLVALLSRQGSADGTQGPGRDDVAVYGG